MQLISNFIETVPIYIYPEQKKYYSKLKIFSCCNMYQKVNFLHSASLGHLVELDYSVSSLPKLFSSISFLNICV